MDDCDWLLSVEKACDWLRIEPGDMGNFLLGHLVSLYVYKLSTNWRDPTSQAIIVVLPTAYPVYLLILLVLGEVSEAPLGEGVVVEDHVPARGFTV